jgi:hypothetical protein
MLSMCDVPRPQPAPRPKQFVRAVIDKLELKDNPRGPVRNQDFRGAAALADILGVDKNTVKRWLKNERMPEYVPTMQMLELAGWFSLNGEAAPAQPSQAHGEEPPAPAGDAQTPDGPVPNPQLALVAVLEDLQRGQEEGLARQKEIAAVLRELRGSVDASLTTFRGERMRRKAGR